MKTKKYFTFFFLLLMLCSTYLYADEFWEQHAEGWHWYQDPKQMATPRQEIKPTDPIQEMDTVKLAVKRALNKAILYPTDENIRNYITIQNQVTQQASLFSHLWRRVLWEAPQLDYSLRHPTNQLGRQTDLDLEHTRIDQAIRGLSKNYGLFFFFRGACFYCHRFAPVLKQFAMRYGITIIPISLDGGTLPEFPNAKINNGAALKLNVTSVPALFAVNPTVNRVIPIGFGLMSQEELAQRMHVMSQTSTEPTY